MNREKAKGYLSISRKAGYLIIGADNLKKYNKKMYLLLIDADVSKTLQKIVEKFKSCEVECLYIDNISELVDIEKCKIVGVKNKAMALEIIKNLRGE